MYTINSFYSNTWYRGEYFDLLNFGSKINEYQNTYLLTIFVPASSPIKKKWIRSIAKISYGLFIVGQFTLTKKWWYQIIHMIKAKPDGIYSEIV